MKLIFNNVNSEGQILSLGRNVHKAFCFHLENVFPGFWIPYSHQAWILTHSEASSVLELSLLKIDFNS